MRLYLDLHAVQSFPMSNLNRDDLGQPKGCTYGGVQRGRVSSQSTKRHDRLAVESALGEWAVRTRRLPEKIADILEARGWERVDADRAGRMLVMAADVKGVKLETKDGDFTGDTNSMLYLPKAAIAEFADLAVKHEELIAAGAGGQKKEEAAVRKLASGAGSEVLDLLRGRTASIAAFGRMLANEPGSSVDGAIQVAHQVTTHASRVQPDYFTAVDDITHGAQDESGSAHMGTAYYASGTYYRYACVNVADLARNMGDQADDALRLTEAFTRAFVQVVPSAKRNSTAPFTTPALVHVAVRTDTPINLVGAFETPITPQNGGGYLPASVAALDKHAFAINRFYGTAGLADAAFINITETSVSHLGSDAESLDGLCARIRDALAGSF